MENRFIDRYKTKSTRLNNWNYSSSGNYFITICTYNHNNFFGKINDEKMVLSNRGNIAQQCLAEISKHFSNLNLNEFVVMPNHVHLLISLRNHPVETPDLASQFNKEYKCSTIPNTYNRFTETPDLASLQDNRQIKLITHSHKNHPNFYLRLNQKSKQTIPKIIQQFKSSVKRICNNQNLYFSWQSCYHDHLITDPKELSAIKNYIISNPQHWQKDKFYNKNHDQK